MSTSVCYSSVAIRETGSIKPCTLSTQQTTLVKYVSFITSLQSVIVANMRAITANSGRLLLCLSPFKIFILRSSAGLKMFLSLPSELLLEIFAHLRASEVINFAKCNKYLHERALLDELWERMSRAHMGPMTWPKRPEMDWKTYYRRNIAWAINPRQDSIKVTKIIQTENSSVRVIKVVPPMNVIVTVSHSPLCSVVVWDIVSMVQLYKVQPKVASDLYGLEVLNGPDGKVYVVAASRDGDIPIYELKQDGSLRHITTRKVEPRGLISLCAPRTRPDFASPILAVGTSDGKLHLVDTATWEFLDTLNGHKGAIRAMSCYGQDYLVTASHDKTARVWNLSTRACVAVLTGFKEWCTACQLIERDGRLIACVGNNIGYLSIWDVATQKEIHNTPLHYGKATLSSLFALHGGRTLVAGSFNSHVKFINIEDLTAPTDYFSIAGQKGGVYSAVSHENYIYTSADDYQMRQWTAAV